MILLDTPRWPAHGTLYGHLVSDSSLWELHSFARRIGLDPRAFDHDHYDLPRSRVADAIAAGGRQVPERHLVQRLRAGGLRIRPEQHAPRRSASRRLVRELLPQLLPGDPAGAAGLAAELVERHQAPGRRYHDLRHLQEMLRAQHCLAEVAGTSPGRAEQLATLFHDVVYDGTPGDDERASAALAVDRLGSLGLATDEVAEVERLVLLTIEHTADEDRDPVGARLVDADLAILASAPGRYHVSVRDIRLEYAHFDDEQWRTGRRQVLEHFLATPQLFTTREGRRRWEESARRNVADELAHLDDA